MPIVINGKAYANRGFTLVEMSIVLVIIGLIIGGILKGQEIIASARQKAVINQVNAIRAAANTYFDRYRALPGDDPAQTSLDANVTPNGNGNGIVGTNYTGAAALSTQVLATTDTENYNFFNGLIAANLLNGGHVTSGVPTTLLFGQTALPAAPITGAGMTVAYGTHNGLTGAAVKTTHWVRLHKVPGGTPGDALSPRTLANMDAQVDDGLPGGGGVRGSDATGCNSNGTTGAYVVSDNIACVGLFEVTQ